MISTVDLLQISHAFADMADEICEVWEGSDEPSPQLVKKAMLQLFDILERNTSDAPETDDHNLNPEEINELGEYGLTLLQEMSTFAADMGLQEIAEGLEDLCFPFAVWLARQECEIKMLEPVVNALARKANHIQDAALLKQLFSYLNEIIDSISPLITQDLEKTNPMRPWRILLINRAIIATRSHDTDLMKTAFDQLLDILPEDAPRFFEEGVEQMQMVDYPDHVIEVMQNYYLLHGTPKTLH